MSKAIQLPSGSWRCQAYLGKDASGKPIRKSFTASTKREAERLAAVAESQADASRAGGLRFVDAARRYIDHRRGVLSPWTITTYERMLRRDFASLHPLAVADLTNDRVQAFVSAFSLDHSPKTVASVYGLLSAILQSVDPDRRLHVRLPQRRPSELRIPDRAEVQRLLDHADPQLRLAILLAGSMGLRRAEISALTWSDVRDGALRIRHAYAKAPDHTWQLKSPKSASGHRVLTIPPAVLPSLQPPDGAAPDDRIVPLTPDAITRRFERLCASLGVSYHFHALRHYYASVLLTLNVPDKYAMQRMGHATPHMLKQVYQHLMQDKQSEIDDQLNSFFS